MAFAAAGRFEEAINTFDDMLQAGCQPDVSAYGALAAAWKDAGEPQECEAVLRRMKAEGLRPNTVIFSTVVQAYGR